jgi:pyruvate ferredoxin oxidoreductase alpha subunit
MMKVVRGFYSVAYSVKQCKPDVICAYPITPQTEIVERLADMYANGELGNCEYITAESEFGAASILVGASATGARSFTATSSQGLILMSEVLLSAAGMRLPIVLVNANRSLSAPLSIWNDQQDSIFMRDACIMQLYIENNQEVHDVMPIAFKVAENRRVMLPFMVCMDGYKLTHAYEPVDLLDEQMVDKFLPPYDAPVKLSVDKPLTFGCYAPPPYYTEFRVAMQNAIMGAGDIMLKEFKKWYKITGRDWGGHVVAENPDAEVAVITMGSLTGLVRDVVSEMQKEGKNVGVVKLRTFRPFPVEDIKKALKNANKIIVFERAVSFGHEGPVAIEIKSANYESGADVYSFAVGLGGRDIPRDLIREIIDKVIEGKVEPGFQFEGVKPFEEVIP